MTSYKYYIFLLLTAYHLLNVFASETDCVGECNVYERNHTEPPNRKQHPFSVAEFPTHFSEFCELGCRMLYVRNATLIGCRNECSKMYYYNVTVKYSDIAEIAKYECFDGCSIGLRQCQSGYYCIGGQMTSCPAGRFREDDTDAVEECVDCPTGRFRETVKGKSSDDCDMCPSGTYANKTGSVIQSDCTRCPAGKYAPEPGMALCICITPDSCLDELADTYRDTVPYIGRW